MSDAARAIYTPKPEQPMNIIVFASGGGGNLKAAINLSLKSPELLNVGLVVTDRLGIPAIDIAKDFDITVLAYDFEQTCGVWGECKDDPIKAQQYTLAAEQFHDNVLEDIKTIEAQRKQVFDLVVLSYHRWIHGKLLSHFSERIINQHAGDLSIMSQQSDFIRKYIGINPVLMALNSGESRTRTSTFLVRDTHDGGEILCQGPWVDYTGTVPPTQNSAWQHEVRQKRESDWPSLTFALAGIAKGEFSLTDEEYPDGCKVVAYKNKPLPYGGVDLEIYNICHGEG